MSAGIYTVKMKAAGEFQYFFDHKPTQQELIDKFYKDFIERIEKEYIPVEAEAEMYAKLFE